LRAAERKYTNPIEERPMHSEIERLIEEIESETLETRAWTGISTLAPEVVEALRRTPRHDFVPEEQVRYAYANRPLPVGFGQTISQPFIVALMTQMLLPQPDHVVLEVGTGSGYQAAVLARLVRRVVSIEIIGALAESAAERLRLLGVNNVETHHADGHQGWPECAPYDGIIVTACAREVPAALVEQLKPGGRMAIPVGVPYGAQDLYLVQKSAEGEVSSRATLPVAFVPLTHAASA
jgi:protein-L-isoaspartate(D-aspartate) O-methyltransferase